MFASIKSEYRKLFTLRSTYFIIGMLTLFMVFFAFYAQGVKSSDFDGLNPLLISHAIINGASIVAAISGIIGLLSVVHEYRYNIIMHTLTSSNSRTKSLFAKIFVLTTVVLVLTAFFGAIIGPLMHLGMNVARVHLVPQTIYYKDLIWQCLFSAWCNMMYAILISVYIRHQVGAVVAYLLIPSTVEGLLGLLLKHNAVYLPFSIAGAVSSHVNDVSPLKAFTVALTYVVGGSIVAFALFIKRDAN